MTERGIMFKPDLAHKIAVDEKDVTRRTGSRYDKWQVGDILVVREKWRINGWHDSTGLDVNYDRAVGISFSDGKKVFREISREDAPKLFDAEDGGHKFFAWRSSMLMYHWVARSRRVITSITREPLWAITNWEAVREGIPADSRHPRQAFAELWDSIHGGTDNAWKHNREVTRIEFKKTP